MNLFNFYLLEPRFEMYSLSHIIAISLTFLSIILLYLFQKRIQENQRIEILLRYLIVSILASGEILLQYWYMATNEWKIEHGLPLQLCDFSIFLCIILLIRKSFSIFEIVYFTGVGGALVAILSPELWLGFPHFRFYHFFLSHAAILFANFYMIWIYQFRPNLKSILKVFFFINGFGVFVFFINSMIDANYMFISKPTYNNTFLNHLGPYPYYLISLEGIMIIICFILYIPFRIRDYLTPLK